jgi:hypothetical protein
VRFIGEPIEVEFDVEPALSKAPGCPDRFVWRGTRHAVRELLADWSDATRRGRMAVNLIPEHAERAGRRGSWGVGRRYFRVRTAAGRLFELYYDRSPARTGHRLGGWFLYRELEGDEVVAAQRPNGLPTKR